MQREFALLAGEEQKILSSSGWDDIKEKHVFTLIFSAEVEWIRNYGEKKDKVTAKKSRKKNKFPEAIFFLFLFQLGNANGKRKLNI